MHEGQGEGCAREKCAKGRGCQYTLRKQSEFPNVLLENFNRMY